MSTDSDTRTIRIMQLLSNCRISRDEAKAALADNSIDIDTKYGELAASTPGYLRGLLV